jgi:hypothetical protein
VRKKSEEIIDKSEKRLENEKGESEVYSLSPFFFHFLLSSLSLTYTVCKTVHKRIKKNKIATQMIVHSSLLSIISSLKFPTYSSLLTSHSSLLTPHFSFLTFFLLFFF